MSTASRRIAAAKSIGWSITKLGICIVAVVVCVEKDMSTEVRERVKKFENDYLLQKNYLKPSEKDWAVLTKAYQTQEKEKEMARWRQEWQTETLEKNTWSKSLLRWSASGGTTSGQSEWKVVGKDGKVVRTEPEGNATKEEPVPSKAKEDREE